MQTIFANTLWISSVQTNKICEEIYIFTFELIYFYIVYCAEYTNVLDDIL